MWRGWVVPRASHGSLQSARCSSGVEMTRLLRATCTCPFGVTRWLSTPSGVNIVDFFRNEVESWSRCGEPWPRTPEYVTTVHFGLVFFRDGQAGEIWAGDGVEAEMHAAQRKTTYRKNNGIVAILEFHTCICTDGPRTTDTERKGSLTFPPSCPDESRVSWCMNFHLNKESQELFARPSHLAKLDGGLDGIVDSGS